MNKFLWVLASLGLCAGLTGTAFADLTVSIKDSPADPTGVASATASATAAPAEFTITAPAQIGDSVVELLKCPNGQRPCVILYPSGTPFTGDPRRLLTDEKATLAPNDTLMFMDACGRGPLPPCLVAGRTKAARIEKSDTEIDKVQIKGLEITSLDDTPRTVTINVDTGPNNFAPPSGIGSRNFPITLFFGGLVTAAPIETAQPPAFATVGSCAFKSPSDPTATKACPTSQLTVTTDPAHRGQMNIATPCDPIVAGANTSSANPCFNSDRYDVVTGLFAASRADRITCVGQCAPQHQALVSTKFDKKGQTLLLLNSGVAAMSRLEVEQFGVEALWHSVADEFEKPFWVAYTTVDELYRAFFDSSDQSGGTLTLAFSLQKTTPALMANVKKRQPDNPPSITLNSIASPKKKGEGDDSLPIRERARNDRSYASFISKLGDMRWRDVTTLDMEYDFALGKQFSGDPRLGEMNFADCAGNSVYVRVALVKEDGKSTGNLLIRLGSSEDFTKKCWTKDMDGVVRGALSGADLLKEGSRRVDVSQISGKKELLSVVETQQRYGAWFVRSISLVVDHGWRKRANYQIRVHDGHVNDFALIDTVSIPDQDNWTLLTYPDLPVSGRSIQISRADVLPSTPILIIPNDAIKVGDSQLVAQIPVESLLKSGAPPGTQYRVDLCLFGGTCIGQGTFQLDSGSVY